MENTPPAPVIIIQILHPRPGSRSRRRARIRIGLLSQHTCRCVCFEKRRAAGVPRTVGVLMHNTYACTTRVRIELLDRLWMAACPRAGGSLLSVIEHNEVEMNGCAKGGTARARGLAAFALIDRSPGWLCAHKCAENEVCAGSSDRRRSSQRAPLGRRSMARPGSQIPPIHKIN